MQILHLTDLHVTDNDTTFQKLWSALKLRLANKYDAIVLSGDITQQGTDTEYHAATKFIEGELLPLVSQQRRRVIIAPGNHDVSWKAPFKEEAWPSPQTPLHDRAARLLRWPDSETNRKPIIRVDADNSTGKCRLLTITDNQYNERWAPFQNFLTSFYSTTAPNDRPDIVINLLGDQSPYSIHVFREEGVVFACLNSCAWNDRYNYASGFAIDALDRLDEEMVKHRDLLRVAVFHHGLVSHRGSPDHLTLAELGRLSTNFDVAIHGHTHADELRELDEWADRSLLVVATGSFAAGNRERPGGLPNQASTLTLTQNLLRWTVWDRREANEEWAVSRRRTMIPRAREPARVDDLPFAASMSRRTSVSANGIATIEVELNDVELPPNRPELILLYLSNELTLAAEAANIVTTGGHEFTCTVLRRPAGPRLIEYYVELPNDTARQVRWRCRTASETALTQRDVREFRNAEISAGLLGRQAEWRVAPRVATESLELCLSVAGGVSQAQLRALCIPSAQLGVVAAQTVDLPETARLSRCIVEVTEGENGSTQLSTTIPHPSPDKRYSLVYEPSDGDHERVSEPNQLDSIIAGRILRGCRESSASAFAGQFTSALEAALQNHFGQRIAQAEWHAYLWEPQTRSLLASFGRFAPRSWGTEFSYGRGVIGYAFRFCRPTFFHSEIQNDISRLVYIAPTPVNRHRAHRWIAAIPLRLRPSGGVVGVLSISESPTLPKSDSETLDASVITELLTSPSGSVWKSAETAISQALSEVATSALQLGQQAET